MKCPFYSLISNINYTVWWSEVFLKNTNTVSKYIPRRPRISINWNPPFQTSLKHFLKNCFSYSKCCFTMLTFRVTFTKWIWVWKGVFQLIQILGLLGLYFDAAVVFIKKTSLLFKFALAILWLSLMQNINRLSRTTRICLSVTTKSNVCFKKTGTKGSSNTLLPFVPVFLKQTLFVCCCIKVLNTYKEK